MAHACTRALALLLGLPAAAAAAPDLPPLPSAAPLAVVDLASEQGLRLVGGAWRYRDAQIVEVAHREPGPDGMPTGAPTRTSDLAPRGAGRADFDDSDWTPVDAASLSARRGRGRLCFGWYRIGITLPERIGGVPVSGATLVFDTVIDDYAEIWVDGEIARRAGQQGGSVIAGWNAPNRVVVARGARPGQRVQLAIFAANGPLSDAPANYLWMRSARLELHPTPSPGPWAVEPAEVNLEVERLDPGLDAIVPANPKLYKLAEGFLFGEGPVWVRAGGYLLFSDPNANRIYKYQPEGGGTLSVWREQSGYDGADIAEYAQPGSNGLTLDRQGRLSIDEHGRRRVVRIERDGRLQVLADRYQGRRLNSPNDLVYASDGTLYFTDPPFGLPRVFEDPRKELPWSGVFAWKDGALRLLADDLAGPNGIALSPDERFLYVANWDPAHKVVVRYARTADGGVADAEVFFDMTGAPGEEALDGVKVDRAGNLYVSGPGGLWILSPDGRHLGTLRGPRLPANFAWGDEDGKTLYLTARSGLYRLPLLVAGIRP